MAKLKIYDTEGNFKREVEAEAVEFEFGIVRKLMALVKIDDIESDIDLIVTVSQAWDSIIKLFEKCFPDVTPEEWDSVKVTDILPLLIEIFRDLLGQMAKIPSSKKG